MKELDGKIAAITGAANGIGRATALELADRGCHVALSDIDADRLEEVAQTARRRGVEAHTATVDVSQREVVYEWADEVVDEFGGVNLIMNNAGVSLSATVEDMDWEDFEWLMDINFWGVTYGTKAFLPHLRRSGQGHVINVSSIFGIMASPTQSAYNAAKFAVRGFTEALRAELELEGAPVSATSVHPGGVDTEIVRKSRIGGTGKFNRDPDEIIREFEEEMANLSPADAARQIVEAVQEDKRRVLVGNDAKFLDIAQRLLPSGYLGGLVRIVRRRWNQ